MTGIPRTFHFVYGLRPQTEPFSLLHYLCLTSCLEVNRGAVVVMHLHHRPWGPWWDRVADRLEVRFDLDPDVGIAGHRYADGKVGRFRYAHLADVARLEILDREGGYYADIDSIFIRPVPRSWASRSYILGRERPPAGAVGSLCNAWIAATPGAEFGRLWLQRLPAAFDGSWSNHSTLLPYHLSQERPDLVSVEGEDRFFALDWTRAGIAGLFEHDRPLPETALSLHLWEHLWGQRDRTDFSYFHRDLVTADYVAFAPTTYARLARPFLPEDVPVSESGYLRQHREIRRRRRGDLVGRTRQRAGRLVHAVARHR